MAPINTDLVGWAVAEQPEAAFLSILIVFILSIALLLLCASCKKHSFQLEEKAPEQKSSTLVSVSRAGDARGARENPAGNEITSDEIGDLEISQGGVSFKAWRSHTLTPGSNPHAPMNDKVKDSETPLLATPVLTDRDHYSGGNHTNVNATYYMLGKIIRWPKSPPRHPPENEVDE